MLMAFEAAARTGSFTIAARELNLTQGAVSKQVNSLEDQLDVELFKRVRRIVELTDAGQAYAQEISKALQIIRNASLNAMTSPLSGMLNLAILPTFGTRWLMPRFPSFLAAHPDITVNFVTKLSPFDFKSENIHAAIHFGSPNWPDTDSTFLMHEEAVPVCSPQFLNENTINTPIDLKDQPLLHLTTRPHAWEKWLKAEAGEIPTEQGMMFEQVSIIAQAAVAGLGAALLPRFLIQSEIDRGELVIIFNKPLDSKSGYYLVTPIDKSNYAPISVFRAWLLKSINT